MNLLTDVQNKFCMLYIILLIYLFIFIYIPIAIMPQFLEYLGLASLHSALTTRASVVPCTKALT
jgi:hypothetical protein